MEELGEMSKFQNVTSLCLAALSTMYEGRYAPLETLRGMGTVLFSHISKIELRDFILPEPSLVRWIATYFPNVQVLILRQPAAWCDQCYTCVLPSFAPPLPDQVVYEDARGLPVSWHDLWLALHLNDGVIGNLYQILDAYESPSHHYPNCRS